MIIYIILGIIGIIVLIFVTGIFLPAERVVSRRGNFNVSPEVLYEVVTNNSDWQYRSSLKDLVIVENKDGMEIWDEINMDGSLIRFKTIEKHPFSFYSFEMKSKLFTGFWTGEFEQDEKGRTIFIATEYIRVKNPFFKTLSYLFFNVGKLMDEYQHDLQKKVSSIS